MITPLGRRVLTPCWHQGTGRAHGWKNNAAAPHGAESEGAMKARDKRRSDDAVQLEMTPMIDVVFQLLIFFIVTLRQDDILSRLKVARPQGDNGRVEPSIPLIEIVLHRGGFLFKGQPVSAATLDRQLSRYAGLSRTANVVVKCTADSPHQLLVQALDLCNKHQMRNLSVLSL